MKKTTASWLNQLFIISTGAGIMGLMVSANPNHTGQSSLQRQQDTTDWPSTFGFGRMATPQEIGLWDIAIRPDGKGLPPGAGNVIKGKTIYALKCASCHGADGKETPEFKLPGPALVSDTSATAKIKTIGNYWPYATTLFDYMRRTMPYNLPGSLTNDEVYSLTAYLLNANQIIKPEVILNAKTLPRIIMPAKKLFVIDDRRGGPEIK